MCGFRRKLAALFAYCRPRQYGKRVIPVTCLRTPCDTLQQGKNIHRSLKGSDLHIKWLLPTRRVGNPGSSRSKPACNQIGSMPKPWRSNCTVNRSTRSSRWRRIFGKEPSNPSWRSVGTKRAFNADHFVTAHRQVPSKGGGQVAACFHNLDRQRFTR